MPTPTIKWRGADGDWANTADWKPHRLPDATDDVVIDTANPHTITHGVFEADAVHTLTVGNDDFVVSRGSLTITSTSSFAHLLTVSGGDLTLGGAATAASFNLGFGTVSGAGTLTVTGPATLAGGELTGAGATVLQGVSTVSGLSLGGGHLLENQGTLTVTKMAGILLGITPGGGVLRNDIGGTLDLQGGSAIVSGLGAASFINAGTFEAAGDVFVGVDLTNTGTVRVLNSGSPLKIGAAFKNRGPGTISIASGGTLDFIGGGTANAAAFTVASGATLDFGGGRFSLGAGAIGGLVALTHGELKLGPNAVTLADFTQHNARVSGSGTLTVTGAATFTGLRVRETGPGATVLQGASTLTDGFFLLDGGRTLENQGTFTLNSGSAGIALGVNPTGADPGGGILKNDAGGIIDLQYANSIGASAGAGAFTNAGTLEKTTSANTAVIDVAVTNTGAALAAAGTLDFVQAITGDGTLAVDTGATLEVDAFAAASLAMTFNGGGATLALGAASAFAATIHGFAATDTIDLLRTTATRAVLESGDRLAVFDGADKIATLQLAGDYTGASFHFASDGAGGTSITVTTPAAVGVAAAPTQRFIDIMAGFGGDPGGAAVWTETHALANRPVLCGPRLMHAA